MGICSSFDLYAVHVPCLSMLKMLSCHFKNFLSHHSSVIFSLLGHKRGCGEKDLRHHEGSSAFGNSSITMKMTVARPLIVPSRADGRCGYS